jgi:hypothetical protein
LRMLLDLIMSIAFASQSIDFAKPPEYGIDALPSFSLNITWLLPLMIHVSTGPQFNPRSYSPSS